MEYQVVPGAAPWGTEELAVPSFEGGYAGGVPYNSFVPEYGMYDGATAGGKVPIQAQVGPVPAPHMKVQNTGMPMHYYGEMPVQAVPEACVPEFVPMQMPTEQSAEAKELETAVVRSKPRWETPRRRGVWTERWQCARELSPGSIPLESSARIASSIRRFVSKIIHLNVGLPMGTVEKWFHLLAEYLELSADEHVIMIALFRKYIAANGPLVSAYDWARPQKWECVLAIACYMSVLLSEEFVGQTAKELKDLLGPQFRFGTEQTDFLKAVDWRINISDEEYQAARDVFMAAEGSTMGEAGLFQWFSGTASPTEKKATKAANTVKARKRTRDTDFDVSPVAKRPETSFDDAQTVPRWD
mmetsp:Transcript_11721/g.35715  ORF Transcript_11721/g.35715 Transcript_11721/m.35715 type:complete len:357 (-) Transcript_11721:122-1192(-)